MKNLLPSPSSPHHLSHTVCAPNTSSAFDKHYSIFLSRHNNPTRWAFTVSCHREGTEKSSHFPKVTELNVGLVLTPVKLRFPLTIQYCPQKCWLSENDSKQRFKGWLSCWRSKRYLNYAVKDAAATWSHGEPLNTDAGHFRRWTRKALAAPVEWVLVILVGWTYLFFWIENDSISVVRCLVFLVEVVHFPQGHPSWLAGTSVLFALALTRVDCQALFRSCLGGVSTSASRSPTFRFSHLWGLIGM